MIRLGFLGFWLAVAVQAAPVRFSQEVLPVLADRCFGCHGPDEGHRKAHLRLDTREGALAVRQGRAAIVPGAPDQSELLRRVLSEDSDLTMPPPESHRPRLLPHEITVLREWIGQGAPWGRHWAFEKPVRPRIPVGTGERNPLDALVAARLSKSGVAFSPPASRETRLRRVSLDLTGLPPTPEEMALFLNDPQPDAYARAVDRLLASPHYGERLAMWWLDAARYADTDGFQGDDTRTNWPWRDWVMSAFNENLPFDQFTLEQFAGDLLPNPTSAQILATAFHRHHMTNGEGGRDPEESRVDYVIDRINTVGAVWLGLTVGCAQCHSHKFDPISHADYYSLAAFFNNIDEDGKAGRGAKPYLSYESPYVARAVAEAESLVRQRQPHETEALHQAEVPFQEWLAQQRQKLTPGYSSWKPLSVMALETVEGTTLTEQSDRSIQASGAHPNQDDYRVVSRWGLSRMTGLRLEILPVDGSGSPGLSRGKSGEFLLTDLKLQTHRVGGTQVRDVAIQGAVADFSADKKKHGGYGDVRDVLDDDPRNGWTTVGATNGPAHVAVFELTEPLVLAADEELIVELRQRSTLGDANIGRFRLSATDEAGPAVRSVEPSPREQWSREVDREGEGMASGLWERLREQFLADHAPYQDARRSLERAKRQLAECRAAAKVDVMVLAERREPRVSHVLVRGVWDKPGDVVSKDVPAALLPWRTSDPTNRLGFARWVTSPDHPLTARVIVNQLWQLCFGAGLVRTPEDFGLQGEFPTHPELLDWLAVELRESGWDIKHLLRLIVTSATYQQSSSVSARLLELDPDNRLLARGARFRLPSWMLRDAALRAGGLLNPALGGPPVKPYQPEGVWEEMFMGRFMYEASEGPAQHRRTLYAFWRRSITPTFLFDAAQRRNCEVRPRRTNTPLQALTLLNDANYLEAARALAVRSQQHPGSPSDRLAQTFRAVLGRAPSSEEMTVLDREWQRALSYYRDHEVDAARLLSGGQAPVPPQLPRTELAAQMVVASLVFNLDEAMTHE